MFIFSFIFLYFFCTTYILKFFYLVISAYAFVICSLKINQSINQSITRVVRKLYNDPTIWWELRNCYLCYTRIVFANVNMRSCGLHNSDIPARLLLTENRGPNRYTRITHSRQCCNIYSIYNNSRSRNYRKRVYNERACSGTQSQD